MAGITFGIGMGPLGVLTDFYDGSNFFPIPALNLDTSFLLADGSGAGITFDGTGFAYFNSIPFTGSISGMSFVASTSDTLMTLDGLTLQVADLAAAVSAHSPTAILALVNGGNDMVTGSAGADDMRITAGAGKDTIHGEGGADIIRGGGGKDKIYGDAGNDTLTGNAGGDAFVFAKGFGVDTVTDFHNTGRAFLDDKIWITHRMDRGMTMFETTNQHTHVTSVHLDFAGNDEIVLTNVHMADVGSSFFHFYF